MNYTSHIKPNTKNSDTNETLNNKNNVNINTKNYHDDDANSNNNNSNNKSNVSKINIEQQIDALNNIHTTPTHPETIIPSPPSSSLIDSNQSSSNYTTLKLDQQPETWDVNQVCSWLESAGLENVVDIFVGKKMKIN